VTIRTTVTVALAMALLGASLPAVDEARRTHANGRVADELDRLDRVARGLMAENEVVQTGQPARAWVTLYLPTPSWGSSGLSRLSIRGDKRGKDASWTVVGGARQSRQLSVPLVGAGDGLTLAAGGRHRLVLELRSRGGERLVVVLRPREGRST
jgi:hypothetical protein